MMGYFGNWNMTRGYDGFSGFGVLGWVFNLLFWILLALLIAGLVKSLSGHSRHFHDGKEPLDILKERYAKGEINKEEFEQKKKDLS